MDFKHYFIYQADYQHWANDMLFNALDRLDDATRKDSSTLFFGSIHSNVDHLAFFYRKWLARLKGHAFTESYAGHQHADWQTVKNEIRQATRALQHWLQEQPEAFFDSQISYRRTLNREELNIWVRDALTHIFTYGAVERGRLSAAASSLGAPYPDMSYHAYRLEMGGHLDHLRKSN
jgi:uncharacterized damage-inducible protein DinB